MAAVYTVGDGKAFATIQLGIDAIPGDLSGQGIQTAEVYKKAAGYAEAPDLDTGFSNASDGVDYIDVVAMVSHDGIRGGGIEIDVSTANQNVINVNEYAKFHGFCVTGTLSYAGNTYLVNMTRIGAWVYNNKFYNINQAGAYSIMGMYAGAGSKILCNTLTDFTSTIANKIFGMYIQNGTAANPYEIHNNTIVFDDSETHSIYNGIDVSYDYRNLSNNYGSGDGAHDIFRRFSGANDSINYNISQDESADDFGGTGNLVSKAAADCFVNATAGSENLRLLANSALRRRGQDNSDLFKTDITGRLRRRWCTGAFEPYPYYQHGIIPPGDNFRENVIDNLKASLNPY